MISRGWIFDHGDMVDGSSPANHLLCTKSYETRDILNINWCRIYSINSRVDKVWFTSSNQTVASERFTVTGWLDVVHQPNNLEVNPPCWEAQ